MVSICVRVPHADWLVGWFSSSKLSIIADVNMIVYSLHLTTD